MLEASNTQVLRSMPKKQSIYLNNNVGNVIDSCIMSTQTGFIKYAEIDASSLMELGILDIIREPIDGGEPNINAQLMKTEVARLAVQATFISVVEGSTSEGDPQREELLHFPRVVAHFAETAKATYSDFEVKRIGATSLRRRRSFKATEEADSMVFALSLQYDGNYGVATVAGTQKGYAPLTPDMSQVITGLLALSIDAGQQPDDLIRITG